jgi:hypothetical protein
MFNSSATVKAATDSDGVYRLEGVPAGKYRLVASAPALVGTDNSSAGEITVTEDSVIEGIDFALSPGGVITGKITDSEGRPVIGERISLKPLEKGEATTPSRGRACSGRMYATDERRLSHLWASPGRCIVSAGEDSDVMSTFLSQQLQEFKLLPGVTDERSQTSSGNGRIKPPGRHPVQRYRQGFSTSAARPGSGKQVSNLRRDGRFLKGKGLFSMMTK